MRSSGALGFAAVLATGLVASGSIGAEAQSRPKVGSRSANSAAAMAGRVEAFRRGLHDLGYVEGQNIVIEYRYAGGQIDRLPVLAAELVQGKADTIVTEGTTATRFAKGATAAIPIVMAQDPDPVATAFVASLARPGGNITGLSNFRPELGGKRLQLLKDIIPALARVTVLGSSTTPGNAQTLREVEAAAAASAVRLRVVDILATKDIEPAFRAASQARADALLVLASPILLSNRKDVAALAAKAGVPAIYYTAEFVEDGGLISYGVNSHDLFRRAAGYVDRILKGAKPGDLPVEQPIKVDLTINSKAARALGLTMPTGLLLQADRVID